MLVEVFLTTDDAAVSAVQNKQPFWPHFDTVGYLVFGFMVLSLFSRPFYKIFFVSYNLVGGIQFYSLCILCLRKTVVCYFCPGMCRSWGVGQLGVMLFIFPHFKFLSFYMFYIFL